MKDFSEWLNDLTGELQEPDHSWIAHAMPEPCGVCGSTEDVCECEEASYHLEDAWAEDLARKLHQHHGGLLDGLGAHTHSLNVGTIPNEPVGHVLFHGDDPRAPDSIKDQHGDVVLGMCAICGAAEVELLDPCAGPKDALAVGRRIHEQMEEALRIPAKLLGGVHIRAMTATEVVEIERKMSESMRKQELAQQIEQSSILWDQYRRGPYQWRRSDDDEI